MAPPESWNVIFGDYTDAGSVHADEWVGSGELTLDWRRW